MRTLVPRLLPLLAAVALLPAAGARAEEKDPFGSLSADQVEKRLGDPAFFVYDNNQKDTFAEGHVPKAKWVDYKALKESDLPSDKGATLVFYCANEH